MSLKNRVFQALSGEPADKLARTVSLGLVTLILLNVLAVMAESVASIRLSYGAWLAHVEMVSVSIFALEYLMRVWTCTSLPQYRSPLGGRLRYMLTPLALVDLLAILPTLLMWGGVDLRVLRVLRLARMLRLAKLGRYSKSIRTFGQVVRLKQEELILALVLMLAMMVVASSLMYMVESQQQPQAFSSIPATMWWTVMTLTTVGYGDVFPITTAGKLLASGIAILGIGLFALPAGIVASAFLELRGQQQGQPATCPHCGKALDIQPKHQELEE
jgi:voltage-gated potassium channel